MDVDSIAKSWDLNEQDTERFKILLEVIEEETMDVELLSRLFSKLTNVMKLASDSPVLVATKEYLLRRINALRQQR